MKTLRVSLLALFLAAGLSSCMGPETIKALAKDPAVVSASGFFLSLGVTPSAATGGYPMPQLQLGYGTFVRCGMHDECLIAAGATGKIESQGGGAAPTMTTPGLMGISSLFVRARNCAKNEGCNPQDTESAKDPDDTPKIKDLGAASQNSVPGAPAVPIPPFAFKPTPGAQLKVEPIP